MPPTNAKSLMKDFRASFRRKKVTDSTPKIDKAKQLESEELAKLVELKKNIGEDLSTSYADWELLGFLRARSLDVEEAEKLLKVDLNLKKFLQIDDFINNHELSELNTKYSVSGIIGFDKEGSLVRVINIGYSDIKGFIHSVSTIDNFKIFIWFLERDRQRQEAENKKTGRKNVRISYIINLEHLSMGKVMYKPALDSGLIALKLLQDHYHDIVKTVYIINSPAFYSSIFKLFKPAIQDDLQQRIKIFDNDSWKEELLENIDADVLPVCYGGNRVDSNNDPMCKSFISWGGSVPESYYTTDFIDEDDPDVISITVPAGSTFNYRHPIPEPGSTMMWHIQAKENDIGIGVFLEESSLEGDATTEEKHKKKKEEDMSKMIQLTPIIRSQCHICPELGSTVSWFSGTLVLHLDNTYSWMNSKEVLLKVVVTGPPTKVQKNISNGTKIASQKIAKK